MLRTQDEVVMIAQAHLRANSIPTVSVSAVRFDSASRMEAIAREFPGIPLDTSAKWIVIFDQGDESDGGIVTPTGIMVEIDDSSGIAKLCMTM